MKTLAQQMAIYNAYHQDERNKMTHFVGVVTVWYLMLDVTLGVLTIAAVLPLLWLAHMLAAQGATTGWIAFGVTFVGGWILQLIGHAFEGRRPALVDNFLQIFVAPVFLVAEALFHFGARLELKREVESLTVRIPSSKQVAT